MKKLLFLTILALLLLSAVVSMHLVSAPPSHDDGTSKSVPVGGYDVPPNYFAVLLGLIGPWIIAVAASAAVIVVAIKKTKKSQRGEK